MRRRIRRAAELERRQTDAREVDDFKPHIDPVEGRLDARFGWSRTEHPLRCSGCGSSRQLAMDSSSFSVYRSEQRQRVVLVLDGRSAQRSMAAGTVRGFAPVSTFFRISPASRPSAPHARVERVDEVEALRGGVDVIVCLSELRSYVDMAGRCPHACRRRLAAISGRGRLHIVRTALSDAVDESLRRKVRLTYLSDS